MQLQDKVAIVTGGAQGIGAAIVRALAEQGAIVAIADAASDKAEGLARDLGRGAFPVQVDVRDAASIARMVEEVAAVRGRIDILVNNAAIFDIAPFLEITEDSFDRQFSVNVRGLFLVMQAVARRMVEQGDGGRIINMASQAGRRGEALVAAYCATKAAVISLTQSAALALIPHGINVNAISPGVVDTPMWDQADALFARYEGLPLGEKKRLVGLAVPAGRMGQPADYGGAAVFLASEAASYIVGQTLNVDGGNCLN